MMARRGVLGILAGGAAALLSGCNPFGSNYSYRYKITVEVGTPQGLKSGYAVHETLVRKHNFDFGGLGPYREMRTRGEAVAVDLPGGQVLFALVPRDTLVQSVLDPDWQNDWVASAQAISGGDTPQGPIAMTLTTPKERYKSGQKIVEDVPSYAMLVRFRDINDPKTVEEVDPADLAASFGAGFTLKRITVEVTDEDVTVGIGERLAWLRSIKTRLIPPRVRTPGEGLPLSKDVTPIQRVSGTNFDTELYK